ncbi:MAG TPA: septal ring lytic transglycosylase RlpA family protein [Desulfomicrobiaceae bacterium]|nr:septal ring lytic transglycosylase RlpA family protein [Desulfomicrobiaceae bacterium]
MNCKPSLSGIGKGLFVVFCLFLLSALSACGKQEIGPGGAMPEPSYRMGSKRYTVRDSAVGYADYGLATWTDCSQRRTASGEPYNCNAMTAAHKTLPFGSLVRVTRLDTGTSTIVRINDRGPFHRGDGRIIDLSLGAAELLEMTEAGVVRVKVEGLK